MIIRYHQLDESERDDVRFFENKGHITYIRYMLLKRMSFDEINKELSRLGFSSAESIQYKKYFNAVLKPVIKNHGLSKYYKRYPDSNPNGMLFFSDDFKGKDGDKIKFCELIKETETETFFGEECVTFYGSQSSVPLKTDGKPIINRPEKGWSEILLHDKRYVIDGMLADGHQPSAVAKHLDMMYDIQVATPAIYAYSKSFMNTKRKDFELAIEGLENEKKMMLDQLDYVRKNDRLFTIGEKMSSISSLKAKLEQIDTQLKRLQGGYSEASYSQGVMEFSNMREIFSDVMVRTHRRFLTMDERTEDSIVDPLSKLINMMSKASEKIISLEEVMSATTKKTISEEMLEVVIPTLDRLEEEEKRAMAEYQDTFNVNNIINAENNDDDDEVLGMED